MAAEDVELPLVSDRGEAPHAAEAPSISAMSCCGRGKLLPLVAAAALTGAVAVAMVAVAQDDRNSQLTPRNLLRSSKTEGIPVHWPRTSTSKKVLASILAGEHETPVEEVLTWEDGCTMNPVSCLVNQTYISMCPNACKVWTQLAHHDYQLALRNFGAMPDTLDTKVNKKFEAEYLPKLDSLLDRCPPCASISCCACFPSTVAEALLTNNFVPTSQEPTKEMLETLAGYSLPVAGDDGSAQQYYDNTVKFYGEEASRADTGWANSIFGNTQMYLKKPPTHDYRKVPRLPDGSYDFGFSVGQLPQPSTSRGLRVGLVADWGCANLGARRVMEELKKKSPDFVIHLGDTYYSGADQEQKEWFLGLYKEIMGPEVPLLGIPGNHDYYSSGTGLMKVIDELRVKGQKPSQDATFFALQGAKWQIIGMDTGILDSFTLQDVTAVFGELLPTKVFNSTKMKSKVLAAKKALAVASRGTMAFLPDDQVAWVNHHVTSAAEKGIKTILLSHHQLFSRRSGVGYTKGKFREEAFSIDTDAGVYETNQWSIPSKKLPGGLRSSQQPAANTRLLSQFSPEALGNVTAWFWGHEHAMSVFQKYAGLAKGRLIGNACIPMPKAPVYDMYGESTVTTGKPWGGLPQIVPNSTTGQGDLFWNLGFVTLDLEGGGGIAKYFELQDKTVDGQTTYSDARLVYKEQLGMEEPEPR